ncbi:uncharacterized protein LOC119682457 [Teleopsis dalmanni]|uniref:uncharacterized protein LOC119682457 n=1 Tax=Teleopsis dalmanni TaxID=139649 RepID=UPI000D32A399|nr:uncharacterized protein LOC119682457 [Teleopsis dalmanni]
MFPGIVYLSCLFAFVLIFKPIAGKNEATQTLLDCANESDFELTEFPLITANRFLNADNSFKCFVTCIYKKAKIMDEAGFHEEQFVMVNKLAKPETVRPIYSICLAKTKEKIAEKTESEEEINDCEKGFIFYTCVANYTSLLIG